MEKNVGVAEARENLGELIEKVQYQGEVVIINRYGKPAVAVVSMDVYDTWKRQRTEFFQQFRQLQEQADLAPSQAEQLASQAVTALREENRSLE